MHPTSQNPDSDPQSSYPFLQGDANAAYTTPGSPGSPGSLPHYSHNGEPYQVHEMPDNKMLHSGVGELEGSRHEGFRDRSKSHELPSPDQQ
jgi:hypothetical protein